MLCCLYEPQTCNVISSFHHSIKARALAVIRTSHYPSPHHAIRTIVAAYSRPKCRPADPIPSRITAVGNARRGESRLVLRSSFFDSRSLLLLLHLVRGEALVPHQAATLLCTYIASGPGTTSTSSALFNPFPLAS